jgi:hypothetical protein
VVVVLCRHGTDAHGEEDASNLTGKCRVSYYPDDKGAVGIRGCPSVSATVRLKSRGHAVIRRDPAVPGGPQVVVVLAAEQAAGQRIVVFNQRSGAGGLAGPGRDCGAVQAGASQRSGSAASRPARPPRAKSRIVVSASVA